MTFQDDIGRFAIEEGMTLEMGGVLPRVDVVYETWGSLNAARDNAVLICPAFSAHSHANSSPRDPSPGWWEGMIGPGKSLDPDRYFIVCSSLIGGSFGSTGPPSVDPSTGEAYRTRFPVVTIKDIVEVQVRLLDYLGIDRLHAAAGGSLGAMETLDLGIRYPGRCSRIIAIAGTDFTRPYTAAVRHIGRRALMLDPAYNGGQCAGDAPTEGLRLAREIGTLFYRSREEFNSRFSHEPLQPPSREGITFDVQSYLDHQGRKAVGNFDVHGYLTLSLAMDLHDVWRGFESQATALEAVDARFHIVAVEEDRLIGSDEQEALHHTLVEHGVGSQYVPISSLVGHDAFLVEIDRMNALIKPFLD